MSNNRKTKIRNAYFIKRIKKVLFNYQMTATTILPIFLYESEKMTEHRREKEKTETLNS